MGIDRAIVRTLVRERTFSLVAVATLALALGAAITVFSLVYGVVLRQLPYPEAEALVEVAHDAPGLGLDDIGVSNPLYALYRDQVPAFVEIGLYRQRNVSLTGDGPPERVTAGELTPSALRVLAVSPILGRLFADADGQPGAAPVAVVGEALWRGRFGGAEDMVGRAIRIDGVAHEVVGVMPAGFAFPQPAQRLWLPLVVDDAAAVLGRFSDNGIARLAPSATIADADRQIVALTADLATRFPAEGSAKTLESAGFRPDLKSRLAVVSGAVRPVLFMLLVAVGLILAIACSNVANLFLVRVEARGSELAVRQALGASRGRQMRDLLAESLALSLVAGVLALGLAWASLRIIVAAGPQIPRLDEIGLSPVVVAFAVALTLIGGVAFGLLPALRGTRSATFEIGSGRGAVSGSRERQRLRWTLVTVQVALGVVLLTGCGLLIRSLQALRDVDPGFEPENALTFSVVLPEASYPDGAARVRFVESALERLGDLPSVDGVAAAAYLPLSGVSTGSGYGFEGRPRGDGEPPPVFMEIRVSPGYFDVMGIPVLSGRGLHPDDHRQRSGAVLVSRSIAERHWPNDAPLGARITAGRIEEGQFTEVVGVAGDVRAFGMDQDPIDAVYQPMLGLEGAGADLRPTVSMVLRTTASAAALETPVRTTIAALDADLPTTALVPLTEMVRASRAQTSYAVVVLSVAAVLALAIAAVGLYGAVAYVVGRRSREIGLRMALGADRGRIRALVLGQGLRVGGLGVGLGLVSALAAARLLESIVFGVSTRDPLTLVASVALLMIVVLAATWLPARRASRIAPSTALRGD